MTPLFKALTALYPGLNFADVDGTLDKVRYDAPLPANFKPPTQAEVDAAMAVATLPASLKRSQIMRQLAAVKQIDAAWAAVQQANGLTYQLWFSDDWHISDLKAEPYATMIKALGIDLPTFWAAAALQPA